MGGMKLFLYILSISFTFVMMSTENLSSQSIEWEKAYGNPSVGDYTESVALCSDGTFALLGRTFDSLGQDEIVLIKLNALGDSIWGKTYLGSTSAEVGYDIINTIDGNLIICGSKYFSSECNNVLLMCLDSIGDTLWTKTFDFGTLTCEQGNSISQTNDSGYIIGGHTIAPGNTIRGFLLKVDRLGDSLWCQFFGSGGATEPFDNVSINDLTLTGLNEIVVSGYIYNPISMINDFYIAKVDSLGGILWERHYGGERTQSSLACTNLLSGNSMIAGFGYPDTQSFPDILIMEVSSNGDSLWSKVIGDQKTNICYDITKTLDSGFIFCANNYESSPPRHFAISVEKYTRSLELNWRVDVDSTYELNSHSIQQVGNDEFLVAGYKENAGGGLPLDLWIAKVNGPPCCNGIRGDVNGDGPDANILDLTFLVDYVFRGSGTLGPCPGESDVNGDGIASNILDLTFLVDVIFRGGPIPGSCP